LFKEVGDSLNIKYKRLIDSGKNFYNEIVNKQYQPDIILTGLIKMKPDEKEISPIGLRQGCDVIFTFPSKELTNKRLIVNGVLKLNLKDAVEYKSEIFDIVNIVPSSIISGVALLYKLEVKRNA
jgi:hypothetical protein